MFYTHLGDRLLFKEEILDFDICGWLGGGPFYSIFMQIDSGTYWHERDDRHRQIPAAEHQVNLKALVHFVEG